MAWRINSSSRGAIDKAGTVLSIGFPSKSDDHYSERASAYRASFQVMDEWRASHAFPLNTIQVTLRQRVRGLPNGGEVYQRLKRSSSVSNKLERFPDMKLSRIQDLGGCRAILSNVEEIDLLRERYKEARDRHILVGEKDYISEPKESGYRGRHLVYKYQSDRKTTYNNHRIEIQLRTKLQHYWATSVEVAAFYVRSPLKSSIGPEEWLDFFKIASSAIADIEGRPRMLEHRHSTDLIDRLRGAEQSISACASLETFSNSHRTVQTSALGGARYFIIEIDLEEFTSVIHPFISQDEANTYYSELELNIIRDAKPIDAVLVSASDVDSLTRGYPNYFLDTDEFIQLIAEIVYG